MLMEVEYQNANMTSPALWAGQSTLLQEAGFELGAIPQVSKTWGILPHSKHRKPHNTLSSVETS